MMFISILLSITAIIILICLNNRFNRLEQKIDRIAKRTMSAERVDTPVDTPPQTQTPPPYIPNSLSQSPPSTVVAKVVAVSLEENPKLPEVEVILPPPVSTTAQYKNLNKLSNSELRTNFDVSSTKSYSDSAEWRSGLAEPRIRANRERKPLNYEKLIGANIFSKIGILVLIIGVGYFIKYAIDNEWINETMRCVLSYLFGVSLLGVAQKVRKNYRAFSSLLAGGMFAIFYLTTALSYHYYDLFSQNTAFAILIATTISMIVLSMLYDRKELSIISVVGGFIAPFLFGDESASIVSLFSYITLFNVAMFVISMRKSWSELPLLCFVFTYCIVLSTYQFSTPSTTISIIVFATLFYLIFLTSTLRIQTLNLSKNIKVLYGVAFAMNNLLYFGIASYIFSDLDLGLRVQGLIPIFIATVNIISLAVIKKYTTKSSFNSLKLTMLAIIITSLTIAVPAQLNSGATAIVWALEMVALLLLYAKTRVIIYNIAALALYLLTSVKLLIYIVDTDVTVWYLISIAAIGGAFFLSAYTLRRYKEAFSVGVVKYSQFNPILIFSGIITYAVMIVLANQLVNDSQLILMTGFLYLTLLIQILPHRFSVTSHANAYLTAAAGLLVLNLIYHDELSLYAYIIQLICVASSLVKIATPFVKSGDYKLSRNASRVVVFNIIIYLTCYLSTILYLDIDGLNLSWTISIISVIIAFIQILVGMKVHFKLLRIVGICAFGSIFVKLILLDLWSLSSGGKITTLILLGIILLVLSFLYQKVQNVLFKDESDNEEELTDGK